MKTRATPRRTGKEKPYRAFTKNEQPKPGKHRRGRKLRVYTLTPGKHTVPFQKKKGGLFKNMRVEF